MKKIFTLASAIVLAMGMNAQIYHEVEQECNYIDFQTLVTEKGYTSDQTFNDINAPVTLANGCVIKPIAKSDGTIQKIEFKYTATYKNRMPLIEMMTEPVGETDSVFMKAGSGLRMYSMSQFILGGFITTGGKLKLYMQPNGDSERGFDVTVRGGDPITLTRTGEKWGKGGSDGQGFRKAYIVEVPLAAGQYLAGDIVITTKSNTTNLYGIAIEGLVTTGIQETMAEAGVRYNGVEIINEFNRNITVFNALGKMVGNTNSNFNMSQMPAGVYMVRIAGVKGAIKIQK